MTNDTETIGTVREGERCTGAKKDGTPCTRIAVRETSAGLRCAWHDPDRSQKPQDRPREHRAPRPPVDALVSPADALALSSWAALMAARWATCLRGRRRAKTTRR